VTRALRRGLLVTVCILAAAGAALGVASWVIARGVSRETARALAAVDADISGGFIDRASATLSRLHRLPRGEAELLSVLKRGYLIGKADGDFALLASLSRAAVAVNRRSPRLRAAAAYGFLRSGSPAEALAVLSRGAGPGDLAADLRGEASVRTGGKTLPGAGLSAQLADLEGSRDPAAFQALAARSGEAGLLLDAALLKMAAGEPLEGARLAAGLPGVPVFDEAAGLMAYDAGDYPQAVSRLARRVMTPGRTAELLVVFGDLQAMLGHSASSEEAYGEALGMDPGVSWTPYLDMARFASARGNEREASAYRLRARQLFPDREEVFLESARAAAAAGDGTAAEAVLAALLARRPGSLKAELMALAFRAPRLSPEAYRGRIWRIFDAHPGDEAAALALLEALASVRDWAGVAEAARGYETASGERTQPQVLLYRGLAAAMTGDLPLAEELLSRVAGPLRGMAGYDTALVLLAQGKAAEARALLPSVSDTLAAGKSGTERGTLLALVQARAAQASVMAGDRDGGRRAAARALALDPANSVARLLARKLEAGREQ
jgi:hypothetical protein